jgi:hypothetical protein
MLTYVFSSNTAGVDSQHMDFGLYILGCHDVTCFVSVEGNLDSLLVRDYKTTETSFRLVPKQYQQCVEIKLVNGTSKDSFGKVFGGYRGAQA